MKKIIFILFFSLLTFIPTPKATKAQIGSGVFYCEMYGTECRVNPMIPCSPGFEPVPEKCEALSIADCEDSYFDCESMYEEECYECNPDSFECTPVDPAIYGGACPYTDIDRCWEECVALPGEAKYRCYDFGCLKADGGEFDSYGDCYDNCDFYAPVSGADPTCNALGGGKGINTAIGCIPVENTNAFIGFILSWGIGIGGGIAFLLIIFAGFQIITSSGDPKRLQAGKELLTAAIAGLVLLIFSVFILRIVGVEVLGIF